ncbi:MAG: crotonase/enoyl-CoA hydratase family protein [Halioglobus sp.]|nr:crotonase/enoyl-CoA hydratase family protein [Halioglobus sp.]
MQYELREQVAVLNLDDGKVNAVGHAFLDFVNEGLDRAQADKAGAVMLCGREGLFSAGFDLKEFEKGAENGVSMVARGMELAIRLYGFPMPVVAACTGHAIAMGAFILLACDTRVGARGEFRFTLPETRINMEIPRVVQALCVARLAPTIMTQAVIQSRIFNPADAVAAGFLDEIVAAEDVEATAFAAARELGELPQAFYAANKMFMREDTLREMRAQFDKALASAR